MKEALNPVHRYFRMKRWIPLKIYINNEELNVTFQEEKVLNQVVLAIDQWLKQNQLFMTQLSVDNKSINWQVDTTWKDIELNTIQELHIWAQHPIDGEIDQLMVIAEYLELFLSAIEYTNNNNKIPDEMDEILNELPDILEGLNRYFVPGKNDLPQQSLQIIHESILNNQFHTKDDSRKAMETIQSINKLLYARIHELQNPLKEALATLGAIQKLHVSLAEVSNQMQSGENLVALSSIQQFIELLQKLTRTLGILHIHPLHSELSDEKIRQVGEKLNSHLEEIIVGMENNDLVLLGDILEYELPEVFESLNSILHKQE